MDSVGKLTPSVFAALIEKARLSSSEVDQRISEALDANTWLSLVPFATISPNFTNPASLPIMDDSVECESNRLKCDGYFCLNSFIDQARIARMNQTIEILRVSGWPAVFAFVYDDFWSIVRSASVVAFLERTLGANYRQNSNVWAHWVAAASGASGWPPHTDTKLDPGKFVNVWIALTDATLLNGCMFVVPRTAITDEALATFSAGAPLSVSSYRKLLWHTTPVPAHAGTVMGWHGDIIHWGGLNHGGAMPRVSLALEFRAADSEISEKELPLFDPRARLPSLNERLFVIAKSMKSYVKMEPLISRFQTVADQLFILARSDIAAVSR